ncbi:hypothetical protein LTR53_011990 [Teratosphaeriaceae sp. CCFEE 6253]|nr:hypothetical protein LTR53_011990 [Teratosphaeriaceae sp. CCFEE 6253]
MLSVDLTPNTLLSLLSTICKASFLLCPAEGLSQLKWNHFYQRHRRLIDLQYFDAASQGQLGALKLLWHTNYRALLANLGAIVTVLAIATDPLTNQLITIQARSQDASNVTASISAAYAYGMEAQDSMTSISSPLSDAMVRGIYAPALQVNYSCASGSCTWPRFESLAFCSVCKDVSDEVAVQCGDCKADIKQADSPGTYSTATCNYTTPGGINASVQLTSSDRGSVIPDTFLETMIRDLGSMAGNSSDMSNIAMDEGGDIVGLSVLRFDLVYPLLNRSFGSDVCGEGTNATPPMIRPKAYSCTLGWCAQSFATTRFQDGRLFDDATSSTRLKIASDYCYVPPDRKGPGNKLTCPVYPADRSLPPPKALGDPATRQQQAHVFWINDVVTTNLQAYLDDTFDFSIGGDRPDNNGNNGYNLATSPALQQTFYTANGGNVSRTMQDMARSLTNELRQGPESEAVPGMVAYSVAYIEVRWAWLAYLVSLCGLAIAFLFAAMITSWRRHSPIWKSSSLALLFHGCSGAGLFSGREIDDVSAMERAARDVRAYLDADNMVQYVLRETGKTGI